MRRLQRSVILSSALCPLPSALCVLLLSVICPLTLGLSPLLPFPNFSFQLFSL